jgi:hypothetical protein
MRIAHITALLLSSLQCVTADVIFSNFGSSDVFDMNTGLTVADSSGYDLKTSLSFVPTVDFQLSQIDFVTSLLDAGDQNQVTLTLSNADADGNPGTVIEVFSFSGQMGILGSVTAPPLILNAISGLSPVLRSDTTYWLTAESSPDVTVVWNQNILTPNDIGTMAKFQSSSWVTQSVTRGTFRISGKPVTITPLAMRRTPEAPVFYRPRFEPTRPLLTLMRRNTR